MLSIGDMSASSRLSGGVSSPIRIVGVAGGGYDDGGSGGAPKCTVE